MALQIVDLSVNCWACVDVCPNQAVVEDVPHFLINEQACTECLGDHAEAQCAAICPIEGAIVNELGEPMHPATLSEWMIRFCARHNLIKLTSKDLRHLHATILGKS